jgi:glutathione S-transferase
MLELYHLPQSICSQKVRICLAEKGLAYQSRIVDLGRFEHLSEEYLWVNPNGVVPALVDDGAAIVESTVICEYLDEVFPDPPLSPPSPLGRAQMRAWLRFIDEVPTAAVRVPSFNDALLPSYRSFTPEQMDALIERMPLRGDFFRRLGRDGFAAPEVEASMRQLRRAMERMAGALDGQPFLCGEAFSIADLCMAPLLQRMEDLALDGLWSDAPAVGAWLGRVRARPSWGTAFMPGSLLTELVPGLSDRLRAARAAGRG